jgi:hypothetical protein
MHLSPVTGIIGEARVRDEEGIRSAIAFVLVRTSFEPYRSAKTITKEAYHG